MILKCLQFLYLGTYHSDYKIVKYNKRIIFNFIENIHIYNTTNSVSSIVHIGT